MKNSSRKSHKVLRPGKSTRRERQRQSSTLRHFLELLEDRTLLAIDLLDNPSFATGDLTGWSSSASAGVAYVTDDYVVDGFTGGSAHYRAASIADPYFAVVRGEPLEVTLTQSFSADA